MGHYGIVNITLDPDDIDFGFPIGIEIGGDDYNDDDGDGDDDARR